MPRAPNRKRESSLPARRFFTWCDQKHLTARNRAEGGRMEEQKNIIVVSGTHGTGKTTRAMEMAVDLKKQFSRKTIGLLLENVVDCPFPVNGQSTMETMVWLTTNQIQRELTMSLQYDLVVSDRCCVDPIAYGIAHFGEAATAMTEALLSVCKLHYRSKYMDVYLHMASKNNYLFADGLRDTDLDFRIRVEKILMRLHGECR